MKIWDSVYISKALPTDYLSMALSIFILSINLIIHFSFGYFVFEFVFVSIFFCSIHLYVCLSICMSVCPGCSNYFFKRVMDNSSEELHSLMGLTLKQLAIETKKVYCFYLARRAAMPVLKPVLL